MRTVGAETTGCGRGRHRPVGRGAVAGLVLLLIAASPSTLRAGEDPAYDLPVPEPVTLRGTGKSQSQPLDVVEGTLVLRIRNQTPSRASGLSISIWQDNNLDGTFCGDADGYCGTVYGAGYDEIVDLDTTVRFSNHYYGGRIKLYIDGPSRGQWSVTVTQEPSPRHRFGGQVRDARSETAFVRGARVTATDARGNVFMTSTGSDGRYNLPVFGFSDYDVTIRAPGYAVWEGRVTRQAFLALGFPGWATSLDAVLAVAPEGPRIQCLVRDAQTTKPLRAQVVCRDESGRDVETRPTDAEGLVVFENLTEGGYTLRASSAGYDEAVVGVRAVAAPAPARVVVDLDRRIGCDLAVTILPARSKVALGETLSATVRVTNQGPEAANAVLHLGLDLDRVDAQVDAAGGAWDVSDPSSLVGALGTLSPGGGIEVKVRLRTKALGRTDLAARVVGTRDGLATDYVPENDRASLDLEIRALRVFGTVAASDPRPGHAQPLPLRGVPVSILPTDGAETLRTFTDEAGRYSVTASGRIGTYRIEIALRDRDGVTAIHARRGFKGGVVTLRSRVYNVPGPEAKRDFRLWPSSNRELDSSFTLTKTEALYDAAIYYVRQVEAARFARNTLGLELDHDLPVDVYLDGSGCSACYFASDSRIEVHSRDSGAWSGDTPTNREYHEFGHHVNADAELGGEDTIPTRASGDKSHGGVDNSDSTDAVIEGFAEFFALMVQGNPLYRWAGVVTNLERNFHTLGRRRAKPSEEFNVAALLWDLLDDKVDAGDIEEEKKYKDHFALGAVGTWALLESEDIEDVSSLYEELEATLGKKDSDASDGVSDLDALFIMHGFFHDANGNGLWDAGEEVGCGLSWRGKDAEDDEVPRRDDVLPIPGTALDVRVLDEDDRSVAVRLYRVAVRFPGGEGDYDYETRPDPADGALRMHMPAGSEQVLLRPVAAGFDADPLALRPEPFWRAVEEAQARGADVCLTPVLRVRGNGIVPPSEVRADVLGPATVHLAWEAAGPVVVVRHRRRVPTLPGDGEIIYEGKGSEVTDTGLFAGTTYRYAVFSGAGDRWSRPASAVVSTPTSGTSSGEPRSRRGLWLGLLVVLGLSVALLLRRRRRRR